MYSMPLMPLICCSSGAATVSAISSEVAPGYTAFTDTVGGDRDFSTGKGVKHTVAEDYKLSVAKALGASAKKVQIIADDEISLKTGSAEIVLKKNGDITIKGSKIKIEASGDMVLKGSKIAQN